MVFVFLGINTGTQNFVSLIVKIILLEWVSSSLPHIAKRQPFIHLSFNSTLQLVNGISSDNQYSVRYFNGTIIGLFSRIPFAVVGQPINLVLYLKD